MKDDPKSGEPTAAAPASENARRLKRGDTLGGRFVIVQFLAQGGMGEVYEAADLHLQGKHYALKTLRAEVAGSPSLRQRFEREVILAREVNHPNVCPTYELVQADGPHGPITFLTMKLLRGESLLSRLRRLGRIEGPVLVSLAVQMADALDAAHRVGVIHRDFKPGNVMIEDSGQEPHLSITDFGLSRAHEADATLAETGQVLGTPGYIAPELIQGHVASFTSDVYAFGVVLYEMATGRKPMSPSGKIEPPAKLAPDLPAVWDRIILGCLEPDPSKRFRSAGEALAPLAPKSGARSSSVTIPMRAGVTRHRAAIAAVLLLALTSLAGWRLMPHIDALLHPLPEKRFVALMTWPEEPDSAKRAILKSVLDRVGSRLARAEGSTKNLLIIASSDVSGASIAAPIDAVGALGANLVLAAATENTADGMALNLTILDASSSKQLRKTEVRVSNSELSRLPDRAAVVAARMLDIDLSRTEWKDRDEFAVSPAAYQSFAHAEELAGQSNDAGLDQAIERYQEAIRLESGFALAYARLSLAYSRKHRRSEDPAFLRLAERNADSALRYNPASPQAVFSRAMVDLRSGKSQEALDGLQRALKLDPGNPEILIYKGQVLRDLDRRAEQEAVDREIIKDRPNYWPAYYDLGIALWRQGKHQRAAEAFADGSVVAPQVAVLLTNKGSMLLMLDRKKEAEEAFRQSIERKPTLAAYSNLGTIAFGQNEYKKALDYYLKARDLNPRDHANWRNIGDSYAMLGDSAGVTESYSKAAAVLSESLQTNPTRGAAWMDLAFYQAKLGRRNEAETALQNAEKRGASDLPSQFKKVQVLVLLGQRNDALTLLLECLKKGLAPEQVALALDLKDLRTDPRYVQAIR